MIEGGGTEVKLAERVTEAPAAFDAVTVQVPVPTPTVVTVKGLLVPEPEATPEQLTEAETAPPPGVQLKVLLFPEVTFADEKLAASMVGGGTTLMDEKETDVAPSSSVPVIVQVLRPVLAATGLLGAHTVPVAELV